MLVCANACLQIAPVSTYQISRSLTICFTLALSVVLLKQQISAGVFASCLLIVMGFIAISSDSSSLHWQGAALGAGASLFQAVYEVLVKRSLPLVDGNYTVLLVYTTLMASVFLLPFIWISGDSSKVQNEIASFTCASEFLLYFGFMILSGVFVTLLNFASFLCIKVTTPLTFNIAGIGKAGLEAAGALLILGDPCSYKVVIGLFLKMSGCCSYVAIKYCEERKSILNDVKEGLECVVDEESTGERFRLTTGVRPKTPVKTSSEMRNVAEIRTVTEDSHLLSDTPDGD